MLKIIRTYEKHYEESVAVNAIPDDVFTYANDHNNFFTHMGQSNVMMGGGKMVVVFDEGYFQDVGSHLRMHGRAFGIPLSLDEVVTEHNPPYRKAWETVGNVNLLVIGHYRMALAITPQESTGSLMRVTIDYDLPKSCRTLLLGVFSAPYAKWCVKQMVKTVKEHFST